MSYSSRKQAHAVLPHDICIAGRNYWYVYGILVYLAYFRRTAIFSECSIANLYIQISL